ncbi:MAG: FtsQ-type POTRA domain-containing protein [Spirochaetales bacterium]|nr:FtsQ-type POTRA domain-containing protein [Spirochaetales bacterium]
MSNLTPSGYGREHPLRPEQNSEGFLREFRESPWVAPFAEPARTRRYLPESEALAFRREAEGRQRLNRFFKILICLFLAVIFCELCYHFVLAPRLVIRTIRIKAEEGITLSDQEILRLSGLTGTLSYLGVDISSAQNNLLRHPGVAQARIIKHFPDTLEILLHCRRPLGVALEGRQEGLIPLVFDDEGVVFKASWEDLGDYSNLPVISGVRFPDPRAGVKLPGDLIFFLKDLSQLKSGSPVLFDLISELKFIRKEGADFEVLVFLNNFRTRARIGSRISENLMKNMLMALDMAERENMSPLLEELDFRSSKIVFKMKEE